MSILKIRPHHRQAIEKLVATYQNDESFDAIIIGGSVAKGCARDDSDVDFMIIANDDEFSIRQQNNDYFINRTDLCDYAGGFVDGKVINYQYLLDVDNKGNEPTRAAFDGAFVPYSRIEGIEKLIENIAKYPESERANRMRKFYSAAFIQNWLMGEADRHSNSYTKVRAASQLALYAGRLILAFNRVLFPYHKWFMNYLEKCVNKPVNFLSDIEKLLAEPTFANSNHLFTNLKAFNDWGVSDLEAYTWFMKDVEWSWMQDKTPLEDW